MSSSLFGQTIGDDIVKEVEKKIEARMYDGALVISEKAIKENKLPDSILVQLYFLTASIYNLKGNRLVAVEVVNYGTRRFPNNFVMALNAGVINARSGDHDTAKYYYHIAMSRAQSWKDSASSYQILSSVYTYQQQWDSAIAICDLVLKRSPNDRVFLNAKGIVYIMNKNHKDGIPVLLKVIELDSTDAVGYGNVGMLYSYKQAYDSAIIFYEKALELNPEQAYTYSNLGFCYHNLGDYKEAIKNYNKSIELNPKNSWVYKNKGITYISMKRNKEACKYLNLSKDLGYKTFYGDEVDELLEKHCEDN